MYKTNNKKTFTWTKLDPSFFNDYFAICNTLGGFFIHDQKTLNVETHNTHIELKQPAYT